MASPLNEIVSELSRLNPEASPNEICSSVIDQIEALLPEVLRTIKLPSLPSPAQIRHEELRLRRVRKKKKIFKEGPSLERKKTFIQQLEYVKHQLNGHEADTSFVKPSITYGDLDTFPRLISRPTSRSAAIERGVMIEREDIPAKGPSLILGRFKEPLRIHTSLIEERREELFPRMTIDTEVQNRIFTDFLFAEVLKAIEIKIRSFVQSYSLKMSFDIYFRRDIEVPEWRKIILGVDVPDLDFDQKMVLWDKIDVQVRQAIHEVEQRVHGFDKDTIKAINRNLFIRMELP